MYGVHCTTPSFGHISKKEQSEILKKLAKRSSTNVNKAVPYDEHSEPEQLPNSSHSSLHQNNKENTNDSANHTNGCTNNKQSNHHPIHPSHSPSKSKEVKIRESVELKAPQYDDNPDSEYSLSPDQTSALKSKHNHCEKERADIECDRQKELRNTFFKLSLLAASLTFISWIILMILMFALHIRCPSVVYCMILDVDIISKSCVITNDNDIDPQMKERTVLLVILTLWVVLVSIIYALSWQWFWRSKRNPLWSKHQQDITTLVTKFLSLSSAKRTFKTWSMLIVCLLIALIIEYFVEKYMYFTGGRYLYCLMVLILGILLTKIIGIVTSFEFKDYVIDNGDRDANELMARNARNCRFHRQCVLVIINTTYALYVPTIRQYPTLSDNISEESLETYLLALNQSATEATFFLWSAMLSSECIGFGIEMFNGYVFGHCLTANKRTNCCSTLIFYIVAFFTMFTVKELYFLHQNWFLAVILFYFGVTFSWLNPSIFLIASGSIVFLCIVYKLRFILLNPEMLQHFVPDIIMLETIFFILFAAFPTEFVLLLPLYNNCKWVSFGGIMVGALLTICVIILYYSFFRIKKLVTKQKELENKAIDKQIEDRIKDIKNIKLNGKSMQTLPSISYRA